MPFRLGGDRGLLIVTVVNYITTDIGNYIEFSIAIACRRGLSVGQWVVDLPVSTEISVKGGKGIWGMPKHQANLAFDGARGQGLEPVRPRRAAVLPDRDRPPAAERAAGAARAGDQLLRVPRDALQVRDLVQGSRRA